MKHNPIPPVAAGMNCFIRGNNAIDEYFNVKGAWPSYEVRVQLDRYVKRQARVYVVDDVTIGLVFAHDALLNAGLTDDALAFNKLFLTKEPR